MRTSLALAALLIATATPAFADCKAELGAIFEAQLATPYRTEMTVQGAGAPMKVTAEVIYPDSYHMKAAQMETIMVKKKAWMKMAASGRPCPRNRRRSFPK